MNNVRNRLWVAIVAAGLISGLGVHTASAELVGVDFGSGSSTPTNWNIGIGGSNPRTVSNLIDEAGVETGIDLEFNGVTGSNTGSSPVIPAAGQIPTHTQSLTGIDGGIGDLEGVDLLLSNLMPGTDYDLYLFTGATSFNPSTPVDVSITHGDTPIIFTQNVLSGDIWINGSLGSNAPLSTFAITATATGTGTISISVTPVVNSTHVVLAGLALEQNVPEPTSLGVMGLGVLALISTRRRVV